MGALRHGNAIIEHILKAPTFTSDKFDFRYKYNFLNITNVCNIQISEICSNADEIAT